MTGHFVGTAVEISFNVACAKFTQNNYCCTLIGNVLHEFVVESILDGIIYATTTTAKIMNTRHLTAGFTGSYSAELIYNYIVSKYDYLAQLLDDNHSQCM